MYISNSNSVEKMKIIAYIDGAYKKVKTYIFDVYYNTVSFFTCDQEEFITAEGLSLAVLEVAEELTTIDSMIVEEE